MLIKTSSCVVFLLFAMNVVAQQSPIVTYLKYNGQHVDVKDSADYIRRLSGPGTDGLYELLEQYPDGQTKRVGHVIGAERSPRFEGKVVSYYPNGNKASELNYENNRTAGKAVYYYENGKTEKEVDFLSNPDAAAFNEQAETKSVVQNYYDTLGNRMVTDGNGYLKSPADRDGDTEEGEYKNGQKEGSWSGTFMKRRYHFEERYQNGELLEGITTDSLGKKFPYKQSALKPQYPGGIRELLMHVGKNYRYPREAVQQRVNGSVMLFFVIDEKGRVGEIKVLEDLGYGTGEEAIRVLKRAKDWDPGLMRGVPVRVSYQLPIRLKVGPQPR